MIYDFSRERLPQIFRVKGIKYYYDPIREKKIQVQPEETVRQQVISYVMDKLKVPKDMIRVEENLVHYQVDSMRRADIIINRYEKSIDKNVPLCVIECKAPSVFLGEKEIFQMWDYADLIGANYVMLTNGHDMICYRYNSQTDKYESIVSIPVYIEQLKEEFIPAPTVEPLPRLNHDEIPNCINEYAGLIGLNTNPKIAVAMINLWDALYYSEKAIPTGDYKLFTMVEDYGLRNLTFGNAGGGLFPGVYRSFNIKYKEKNLFVSFTVSTYVTEAHPDTEKTTLNIAIEDIENKTSHHSLQLVADDNISVVNNKVTLYHSGRIGISNIGSGKISELRLLAEELYPEIVVNKKFCLGTLVDDHNWTLDEPEMVSLLENLISYALIRDEYRQQVIKSKGKR